MVFKILFKRAYYQFAAWSHWVIAFAKHESKLRIHRGKEKEKTKIYTCCMSSITDPDLELSDIRLFSNQFIIYYRITNVWINGST